MANILIGSSFVFVYTTPKPVIREYLNTNELPLGLFSLLQAKKEGG